LAKDVLALPSTRSTPSAGLVCKNDCGVKVARADSAAIDVDACCMGDDPLVFMTIIGDEWVFNAAHFLGNFSIVQH
jgi:hypothetical protein